MGLFDMGEDMRFRRLLRTKRASSLATADEGYRTVFYHNTPVVRFNSNEVILNDGGWRTNTTKTRMNQTSRNYGLGFNVFQKDYAWFVEYNGTVIPYSCGMKLRR